VELVALGDWMPLQPVGTVMLISPPSICPAAVKVKLSEPVLLVETEVGETIAVPEPSAARVTFMLGKLDRFVNVPEAVTLDLTVKV
jgi:hypothetical protein